MKLNNEEYNALEGIRRSDLWWFNKTPMHFAWHMSHKDAEEENSKDLSFGIAAHKYVLEHDDFDKEYAVVPRIDRRTKVGKEEYERFIAENEGKELISEEDMETIKEMYKALQEHQIALYLLNGGRNEEVFTWIDKDSNIPCKIKCDSVVEYNGKPYVVDYKTTRSCENGVFERSARHYGYDFQAGMYCEGVAKNTLEEYGFVFVAQEKTAPYAVRVYWCSDEFIESGKRKYHGLIKKYHECKETNSWPGYEDEELLEEYYG